MPMQEPFSSCQLVNAIHALLILLITMEVLPVTFAIPGTTTCTNLPQDAIQLHCNNSTIRWICYTCENNTHCAKCNIKFAADSHEIIICCDHCDKYFHLKKCTNLTLVTFRHVSTSNDTWCCRPCQQKNVSL